MLTSSRASPAEGPRLLRSRPRSELAVALRAGPYRRWGKRVLDLALGTVATLLVSPLLLIVAVLVRFRLGPPVLFRQTRAGLRGKSFTLLKFRTMTTERDTDGRLLPDEDRLTRFGAVLRSTSLDELPTLINVLSGDISLVGPRPLLVRYLDRYTPAQMRRHEVRPGITGWTQVNGRNALTWDQKFDYDVWYVDHVSFRLDLKVLLLSVRTVLKREGISQPGHATAEEFMGTRQSSTASTTQR